MVIDKTSPIPQYYQLQTWLVEQIEQGVFQPDDRIPTEEEFVAQTGLARATVRQAIQNLVNQGYLTRRRRLGTFVNAPRLDPERQSIIAVLVHDIRSGYAPEFLRGAADEADRNHYGILLCNTDDLYGRAENHIKLILDHNASGVIFIPTAVSDEKNRVLVDKLLRRRIPVVLADRQIDGIDVDTVITDNFQGAYELTKYLIGKGHRRIAVTLSTVLSSERRRLDGYKQALQDFDIPYDASIVHAHHERFVEAHSIEYARILLKKRDQYSAIFAGNDKSAYLFYQVAKEMGLRIPQDFSIVGYDDLQLTGNQRFGLTTIHQPIYEMGQVSMQWILARLYGEIHPTQRIELKSFLVERDSVRELRA
ncbi:GntR family transcriptional regulator [candidate division KSB1 bacterium]|nr:GntR family transcriptional regulator [candidate division KSB1 bacterium]